MDWVREERKNKDKHTRKEGTQNGDEGREEGGAKNMARLHMKTAVCFLLSHRKREVERGSFSIALTSAHFKPQIKNRTEELHAKEGSTLMIQRARKEGKTERLWEQQNKHGSYTFAELTGPALTSVKWERKWGATLLYGNRLTVSCWYCLKIGNRHLRETEREKKTKG